MRRRSNVGRLGLEAGRKIGDRHIGAGSCYLVRTMQKHSITIEEPELVSVVIPCYNQAHFLGETIESVLSQSYPRVEVIVVDDGSTDNANEVAASYDGVKYLRQENSGVATARNVGLKLSRGEFIVFLDGDDRLLRDALRTNVEYLKSHPECAFVSGQCRFIESQGNPLPTPEPYRISGDCYASLLRYQYIWTASEVMYRRSVFNSVLGFDPSLKALNVSNSYDLELYLRISRQFSVGIHEHVIVEYRQHSTNISGNPKGMLKSISTILDLQREYFLGNTEYQRAYADGKKLVRHYYGEMLLDQIGRQVRTPHKLRDGLEGLFVLMRHYPRGLANRVGKKILRKLH